MMTGDQCELLDDFDAGIYSGGLLSKYGQRHVHTKGGYWVSTRRNPPKPVLVVKAKAKAGKKGGAKKKTGAAGGGKVGGADKKKPAPKKKKATPKGKKAKEAAAATKKAEEEREKEMMLQRLDQLAEDNEVAGDDGSVAFDEATAAKAATVATDTAAKAATDAAELARREALQEAELSKPMMLLVCQDGSMVPTRPTDIEQDVHRERLAKAKAEEEVRFSLKIMDFILNMMDVVLKMMDFVLKMMDFVGEGGGCSRGGG